MHRLAVRAFHRHRPQRPRSHRGRQRLTRRELRQLGVQVHGSLGRAIQPFHALVDGDVLYTVSTAEVVNEELTSVSLGVLASELAWDAVLSCFDA